MNEFIVRVNGNLKQIKIIDDNFVEVDDIRFSYAITELNNSKYLLKINDKFYETSFWKNSRDEDSIQINNSSFDVNIRTALQEKAYQLLTASQSKEEKVTIIKSPMPGLVLKILKSVGDNVTKGDTVMILEAMKMENIITAPIDGTISAIPVEVGKSVMVGDLLVSIKNSDAK